MIRCFCSVGDWRVFTRTGNWSPWEQYTVDISPPSFFARIRRLFFLAPQELQLGFRYPFDRWLLSHLALNVTSQVAFESLLILKFEPASWTSGRSTMATVQVFSMSGVRTMLIDTRQGEHRHLKNVPYLTRKTALNPGPEHARCLRHDLGSRL